LAITALGAIAALGAVVVAPWWAAVLVTMAVLLDALDGAVAVLSNRASSAGAVADRVADRIADCAFAAVIWRCGAPWLLAVSAAGLSMLLEGWREVRRGHLLTTITVAERPTRAICTLLACVCAGVSAATWPATVCAAVWCVLGVLALVHFRVINSRCPH
jgi:CDP-diacylglycerol--glycerol-3-phosphate 3-phosphatidyltransferase